MTDGTAETEAPATRISEEIQSLRKTCDMLKIDWHHRNSAKTLQSMIAAWNEQEHTTLEPQQEPKLEPRSERMTATEFVDRQQQPQPQLQVDEPAKVTEPSFEPFEPRVPRTIPPEIVEALTYMSAYRKAYADKVKAFIQSLL